MKNSSTRKKTVFFLTLQRYQRTTKFTLCFLSIILFFPSISYSQAKDTTTIKHQVKKVQSLIKQRKYKVAIDLIDSVLLTLPKDTRETDEDALYLVFRKSSAYLSLGDYKKAINIGEECLSNRKKVLPAIHMDLAKSHNNLGICYRKTRSYTKALDHHKQALFIRQSLYNNKHRQIAKSYNNIGHVYMDMTQYDSAHWYHNLAIEMYKAVLGSKSIKASELLSGTALIYHRQGLYNKAIATYKQAIKELTDTLGIYDIRLEWPYNNIAALLGEVGRNKDAIVYDKLALQVRKKNYAINHFRIGYSHNNLGLSYRKIGDFTKAKEHLETAISIFQQSLPKNHPILAEPYNHLAGVYLFNGNYDKTIEYLGKALQLWEMQDNNQLDLAMGYFNLSTAYASSDKLDLAKLYNNKALSLRKKLLESNDYLIGESYFNSGLISSKMDSFEQALSYYNQAFKIFNQLPSYSYLAQINNNIGGVYLDLNQLDSAFYYYSKCQKIFFNKQYTNNHELSTSYFGLAKYYIKKKEYAKAESSLLQAFTITGLRLGSSNKETLQQLSEILKKANLFQTIKQLRYNQTKDINHLYQEKQYMDFLLNRILKSLSYIPTTNKIQYSSHLGLVFHDIIKNEFDLFLATDSIVYLKNSYHFAERSKAFLLFESLKQTEALHFSNIQDSLLETEEKLQIDIAYFDRLMQDHQNSGFTSTDSIGLGITSKRFETQRKYDTLINLLESNYPKYFAAKHDLSTISLNEVQSNLLQPNQTMLEYIVGDSSIFIFLIQKDYFEVKEVKLDFPLKEWVQMMTKDGIFGFYSTPKALQTNDLKVKTFTNYSKAAQNLYSKLVHPFEEQLTHNLIIIPDGILGYIPFEALLTKPYPKLGAFKAYPYLINRHQVSYSYSATILKEMMYKKHQTAPRKQLLSMAPFAYDKNLIFTEQVDTTNFLNTISRNDSLSALPASGVEIAYISKWFKGDKYKGQQATLDVLLKNISNYKIIHLSTHAKADDRVGDYAYLAFSNPKQANFYEKLYARDIYNLDLNADMIVLSACETGLGKLKKGEGIISLARAFAYAGSKSVFTTLWKVNDTRTKDVIVAFYKYLKEGLPKDEALRKAKLDYLRKGYDTHPYFWSGLIGIGDMSPIQVRQ